jgi:pyruvate carboxylase
MYEKAYLAKVSGGWPESMGDRLERQGRSEVRPGRRRIRCAVRVVSITTSKVLSITTSNVVRTWVYPALPDQYQVVRRRLGYEVAALPHGREVTP